MSLDIFIQMITKRNEIHRAFFRFGRSANMSTDWNGADDDWTVKDDWSSGAVPGSGDDVVIAQGSVTVSDAESAASVGVNTTGYLLVLDTLSVSGDVETGGPGAAPATQGGVAVDGGVLDVGGNLVVGATTAGGSVQVENGGSIDVAGKLSFGGGSFGSVNVGAGGHLDVSGDAVVGDQAGPGSTPGTNGMVPQKIVVIGDQSTGTMATADFSTLTIGGETATVDSCGNWTYTGTTGELQIKTYGYVSVASTFTLANPTANTLPTFTIGANSSLEIGGNSGAPSAQLQIDSGGTFIGHGTINVPTVYLESEGTIVAQHGELDITGSVTGTGTSKIEASSTLTLDGAYSGTVQFDGGYLTTLQLNDIGSAGPSGDIRQDFNGTITGLQDGDTIDLSATNLNTVFETSTVAHTAISRSTLTVTMETGADFTIDLGGSVSGHVFTIRDLPNGDTGLTYEPDSPKITSGSEGGAAVSGVPTSSDYIKSLVWGWGAWNPSNGPISYYFGEPGDKQTEIDQHGDTAELTCDTTLDSWTGQEEATFQRAVAAYAAVCGLSFVQASSAQSANVVWWLDPGIASESALGISEVPAQVPDGQLWQYFDDTPWADTNQLSFGGDGNDTIVHELGHTLGLAHPFDGGVEPDRSIFLGVTTAPGTSNSTTGVGGQNQGVYTIMSYNPGWDGTYAAGPAGAAPSLDYGAQGALGALDIGALQALYGPNNSYHAGNDTYVLPTLNASGTGYSCIWDTGGNDTITNAGSSAPCTIDLRAAPLVGPNAGGYVSYVQGIAGGFTIANGVDIENAVGGDGDDTLIAGSTGDTLTGGGGTNTFQGTAANLNGDTITDLSATDKVVVEDASPSQFSGSLSDGVLTFRPNASASVPDLLTFSTDPTALGEVADPTGGIDLFLVTPPASNTLAFTQGAETMILDPVGIGSSGVTTIDGAGHAGDRFSITGDAVDLSGITFQNWAASNTISIAGGTGHSVLKGSSRAETIDGEGGGDTITGGSGNDAIYIRGSGGPDSIDGGAGLNTIYASTAAGSGALTANLVGGTVSKGGETDATIKNIQNVVLGSGPSSVIGLTSGTDNLYGGSGADSYYGEGATDYVYGGTSTNTVTGGTGKEFVYGEGGSDTLRGGSALNVLVGGSGTEILYGSGDDYQYGGSGLNIMVGSTHTAATDYFYGRGGADYVYDEGGSAYLFGGDGTERLYAGSGTNVMVGASTADTNGNTGTNYMYGGAGANAGTDYDYAGIGTNVLVEGSGTDTFHGSSGTDYVYGGSGSSFVFGGSGTDFVYTGAGNQYLSAGTGNTFFEETAADLTSGRFDQIDKFETASAATGGRGTYIYMPAANASTTHFANANGGTLIYTPAVNASGNADIFVSGVNAATVQKQTMFDL